MLSFEEKRAIFHSFKLIEKKISNGRVSFVYPESKQRGQVLASQLHPSGNGYVIGKYMSEEVIKNDGFEVDSRGWITIRDFSKDKLMKVITAAMESMSGITEVSGKAIGKEEPPAETFIPVEISEMPENPSEINEDRSKEVQSVPTYENPACSFLNNWIGLTESIVVCGLLVWKSAATRYILIRPRN